MDLVDCTIFRAVIVVLTITLANAAQRKPVSNPYSLLTGEKYREIYQD